MPVARFTPEDLAALHAAGWEDIAADEDGQILALSHRTIRATITATIDLASCDPRFELAMVGAPWHHAGLRFVGEVLAGVLAQGRAHVFHWHEAISRKMNDASEALMSVRAPDCTCPPHGLNGSCPSHVLP